MEIERDSIFEKSPAKEKVFGACEVVDSADMCVCMCVRGGGCSGQSTIICRY